MENEILETIENQASVEEVAPEVIAEAPAEEEKPKRRRRRKTNVEAEMAAEFDNAVAAEEAPASVVEVVEEQPKEPIAEEKSEEKPEEKSKATKKSAKSATGAKTLNKVAWLYPTSVAKKASKTISGEIFLWNPEEFDGRVRVCKSEAGAGVMSALLGWVDVADID